MSDEHSLRSGSEAKPSPLKRATTWYGYVSDVLTPQRVGLLLGAALLAGVSLGGGLGLATEALDAIPVVEQGEIAAATPFEVTVKRARVFDELATLLPAEPEYRYISVSVDVTNASQEFVSAGILTNGVNLDVRGLRSIELTSGAVPLAPQAIRTSDSLSQSTFQPGLTTNVVLVWQQAKDEAIPDDITVTFDQYTWRRSAMDRSFGWHDASPAVRLTLPLEPMEGQ